MVGRVEGVLKARRKEVDGRPHPGSRGQSRRGNDEKQLTAKSVSFRGDDLEQAQAIQAGLHETQEQSQRNKEKLAGPRSTHQNAGSRRHGREPSSR